MPVPGELPKHLAGFRVISCDVFDTALRRRLARPEDVPLALGARARAAGLITCTPEAFREYRLAAERAARDVISAAGHDEVRLDEICDRLAACGVTTDPAALAALECATERDLCRPNAALRAVLAALPAGQRLVFVSDTVLPGPVLAAMLAEAGFGAAPDVFTSADLRLSKDSGRLFPAVLERAGCTAKEMVHLGDNPFSDVARPRAAGIATIHLPPAHRPGPEPERLAGAHHVVRLAHSLRRARFADASTAPPEVPALARYAALLLLGFTRFVLAEAARRGIRRIYFLARDGHLPLAIARRLAPRLGLDLELGYLEVSRRSVGVPLEGEGLAGLLPQLLASVRAHPIGTAFEAIGLDAAAAAPLWRELGIDPERRVDDGFGRTELLRFLDVHGDAVRARLAERRALALAYLSQEGFLAPGPRMVVDVGWRGSTQEVLADLAGLPARDVVGCYLGLRPEALRPALGPDNAAGYLFTFGHPKPLMAMALEGYVLFELFFSAPTGTVLHYARDAAGRVRAVHAEEAEPGASLRRAAIAALEADCLAEFEALDEVLDGAWPEAIDPTSALLDLEGLLTRPTATEVRMLNAIPFVGGVTMGGAYPAITPVSPHAWLRNPTGVLRRLEHSPWRSGAVRASLPWPLPFMPYPVLAHRLRRVLRMLRLHP